jgi:hypothetical protein
MTSAPTPVHRGRSQHRLNTVLLATIAVLLGAAVVLLARHDWGSTSSSAGTTGSGVAATQTRTLPSFTAVDLAGGNIVTVRVGGKQAVVVRADDNLIKLVTTEVRGGALTIADIGSFTTKTPMRVDVTVPSLEAITLSGSGMVDITGVKTGPFTVRVPGSGVLTVTGNVDKLDVSLAGSGDVQLQGLVARDVKATVSGSGRLQVNATHNLDASLSGTGAIFYSGNPSTVNRNVTGSGAILGQ